MKHKVKEWVKRYLPSEIAGTVTALIFAYLIKYLTGNLIYTAIGSACAENIVYFSIIILKDIKAERQRKVQIGKPFLGDDIYKISRNVVFEFGLAEALNTLLLRPFFLYIFPLILHNFALGILTGKIVADITFYIPVIISYEMRKRLQKD